MGPCGLSDIGQRYASKGLSVLSKNHTGLSRPTAEASLHAIAYGLKPSRPRKRFPRLAVELCLIYMTAALAQS